MVRKTERPDDADPLGQASGQGTGGLLGDMAPVGSGVWEMREFFGPGWRMYYVERDGMLIVMLGGGDKSSQSADIAAAQALSNLL